MSNNPGPREKAKKDISSLEYSNSLELFSIRKELDNIDHQIRRLKTRRENLAKERQRLVKALSEPRTFERRNGRTENTFVHVKYFVPYIEKWILEYGKGARVALAMQSAVNVRTIRRYLNGELNYAGVISVDRLLTAMNIEHLIDNIPTITLDQIKANRIPNPPQNNYYEE